MVGLTELDQIDYGVAYQRGEPSLTQQSGLAGLAAPSSLDIARANQQALGSMKDYGNLNLAPPPAAAAPQGPVLAISRSSGKIWANGKLFTLDDAQGAIESEQYLNQPPAPAPAAEAGDWEELDPDAYAQHLATIKNPGMGTLASKNFGIGVDNMQMLGGYGMQFLGAKETGQAIVQNQLADLNKNAPYQRNFEDIGSDENRGVLDWFVANLAQQGPNLVESAVTAIIGGVAGGAAGGGPNPATAVGGALSALVGKQAFKQSLLTAVKKYTAGEALDAAETKLLKEAAGITAAAVKTAEERGIPNFLVNSAGVASKVGADDTARMIASAEGKQVAAAIPGITAGARQQGIAGGAAIATGAQNYATGVSDLYGDSIEGGDPSRGYAAAMGVPYAAMESLPEFVAALRVFKGVGDFTTKLAGKSIYGKAGEVGLRIARGGSVGATLEGTTELGQEALGIGANDAVDVNSPEGLSRMLNAFAAGAAIGGFIGAGSNMNLYKPYDLLSGGTKPADQNGPTITSPTGTTPGAVPFKNATPPPASPVSPAPAAPAASETPAFTPPGPNLEQGTLGLEPQWGGSSPIRAPMATPVSPPTVPTQQDMFGGEQLPLDLAPPPPPLATAGSALTQVAAGGLPQAQPGPNRLLEMRLAQSQKQLAEQGQSALAQTARMGELNLVGGSGQAPAQVPTGPMQPEAAPNEKQLKLPLKQPPKQAKLKKGKAQPTYVPPSETEPQGSLMLGDNLGQAPAQVPTGPMRPVTDMGGEQLELREVPNAAEIGPVEQGGKLKRPRTGGRLEEGRVNRDLAPQVQEAGSAPSGGNRLKQGKAAKAETQVAQAEQQPRATVASVKMRRKPDGTDYEVTLSDGRKAIIYKSDAAGDGGLGAWHIDHSGNHAKSPSQDGYVSDVIGYTKAEALENVAERLDQMEAAVAKAPAPKANKLKAKRETAPENGKQDVPAEVREEVPEVKKPKEKLSPKSEGAAAAPAQKAEDEDVAPAWEADVKQIVYANTEEAYDQREEYESLDFALWTYWQNISDTLMEQGYKGQELDRAYRYAEVLFGKQYDKLMAFHEKEKTKTRKTDIVVYNPAPIVDPEVEAALAKAQRERDEFLADQNFFEDDQAIANDLKVQINTNDPSTVEYKDSLTALMDMAKDPGVNKDIRADIKDWLEAEFTPDELKAFQRTMKNPVTQGSADFDTIITAMEQINNGEITLTQKLVGALVSAWKRLKPSDPVYGAGKLADYIKGGPQFFNMKDGKVVPKQTGRYSTTLWDTPESPLNVGKLKLIIGKFVSKYAKQPKVHVFRNQADLKASDPKLYARMAAGRPGDFDTVLAAGYSMDDTVIIFSDRIGSEDHLAFVLAHETLGHFGLRGLMGAADFDKLMVKLYGTDSRLTIAVDAAMKVRGMSKAEAVEEYLSDYAAQLHTSLVRRVWNGIKGVLNRVGIKFGDEATRYLLSQAKRYVKTGERTGAFNTSSVLHKLWSVETGHVGRFAVVDVSNANEMFANTIKHTRAIPMDLKDAMAVLKDGNWTWDSLKEAFFSLANFQALRNPGLYAFEKLLDETRQREAYIFNKYNSKLEKLLYKGEKHLDRISRMLMGGRVVSVYRLLQQPLGPDDVKNKLFEITDDGELERNETAVTEYKLRGTLSKKALEEGVTVKREVMGKDGKTTLEDYKFEGFGPITDDEYKDYLLARDTIADVETELLRAKYLNYLSSEKVSTKAIRRMLKKNEITEAEKIVKRTANIYKNIYVSGYTADERGNLQPGIKEIQKADKFLEAVNRALIDAEAEITVDGKKTTVKGEKARAANDEALRKFLSQEQADDFMATIDRFRSDMKVPNEKLSFVFQNEMKRVMLDDVSLLVEEERAKRTMAGGYVPVIRDNAFEMRVEAVTENGTVVKLHEDIQQTLVYSQFDSISQAERTAQAFTEEFKDKTFEVWADKGDGFFDTVTVKFRAAYGPALTETATDPALNLDEFLHGLRLFKINLTPDRMEKIFRELTASGDQLRKRLKFSNTPGYDKDSGVFAMARHIQLRGATIAKTITRPRMRELLDRSNEESEELWNGDTGAVFSLYNRWKDATDVALKQHYRHQLDFRLSMYRETYPGMKGWDGSRASYDKLKAAGGLSQNNANRFYNSAQRTMKFLEANKLVTESNFGAGRTASVLRALTSILQLGGSIAQGVMNLASPYTNWLPYMASYNAKNGFGGGFSVGKVMAAYHVAMSQVGLGGMVGGKYNTAKFYDDLTQNDDALIASGLTLDEAEALAGEIREGKLIPAQSNALLGTARAGWTNRIWLRSVDAFMAPFNLTEQASRRSAFLAAYRLAKQRNKADMYKNAKTREGKAEYDKLLAEARDFAVQSLDLTLGEYSVLNRPPAWRDGIQSFLYMYKVYPTTTIQMFRRLDRNGKVMMLGMIWMLSGVAGFPFAEDIEDLLDTIAQALGLQMGSVRVEFTRMLEDIAPGLSPYVLKGAINTALGVPADVASRFSQGDFIPGTGVLLAGSTIGEEVKDILGPMPAMALGAVSTARDLVSFPFSESKTLQGTLRASPITLGRMVGDSWAYLDNGAVVDRRGYVVSPEMNLGTIAFRLMGFYPKAAADQYEAIKYAKRVNNYQKEIVAGLRMAWIREYNARNFAGMRQVEQTVEEWNRSAKGTGLEITNFKKNSQRAAKEANMSAAERTLRATSKAGREDTSRIMDAMIAE